MRKLIAILSTLLITVNLGFAQGVVSRPTKKTQKTVKTTGQKNPNRKKSSSESKKQTNIQVQNTNPSTPSQPKPEKKTTSGYINGHEWVDLGLPSGLKWATCNVGASTPEAYGNYYAWGETKTKSIYTEDNSPTYGKDLATLKAEGIIDANGQLNRLYDAASTNLGSTWRMPTKEEFDELSNKCKWEWTSLNGKNGYKVTGPNGNSIFLPAAGYHGGSSLSFVGRQGNFWCSTVENDKNRACYFYAGYGGHGTSWYRRILHQSIRPVSK